MSVYDIYFQLGEYYHNPETVIIGLLILIFALVFYILTRTRIFGGNRGVSMIIALSISLMAVYYFFNLSYEIVIFNILLGLAVLLFLAMLIKPFIKFLRKQF